MNEIIYGKNVVIEALKAGRKIYEIYLQNTCDSNFIQILDSYGVKYKSVDKRVLDQKVSSMHQGVVAVVEEYKYYPLEVALKYSKPEKPVYVMLDGLEDPHNLGAILRTCDASGINGVIIAKNRSVRLNATVAKVSAGAIEYVKVIEVVNLNNAISKLKDAGYWLVGAEKTDDSVCYDTLDYDMPIVLVVGSEGRGISRLVRENCDYIVNIPMLGHVTSLNASVSAAILIYEIIKSRR